MQPDREVQVDALRGVAAMCVVAEHAFVSMKPQTVGMFSGPFETQELLQWLTHVVFSGRAAVLLFFVISGYAMKLQWDRQSGDLVPRYFAFLTRRAFRILPAMWAAIITAWIIGWAFSLPLDLSLKTFWQSLAAQSHALNAPLWSIIVEIHCSIALPFVIVLHKRISAIGHAAVFIALLAHLYVTGPLSTGFLVFFYCGVLLHDYGSKALDRMGRGAVPIGIGALFAYCIIPQLWVFPNRFLHPGDVSLYIFLEIIPATIILMLVAGRRVAIVDRALNTRPLAFLGAISYSIYLLNWPITQAWWTSFLQTASPFWDLYYLVQVAFFIGIASINILAAWLLYRSVELPLNRLGRTVADHVEYHSNQWLSPNPPALEKPPKSNRQISALKNTLPTLSR
ncbi:Peptidoglycan/LPS O-acetylase OafA/YrhL, contains acyltransferase and SGNH-hydrolase domains [Bradyrhizobium sp. NFR13]|nr:Peptidoglycan/LPS O-acetylase OafA/YrhL, contains acyltransferase and SGNH-hydrolase domains [Bradyrhizobium sp. NFR13]